jgi:branched-chain amino acid transport system permease protein
MRSLSRHALLIGVMAALIGAALLHDPLLNDRAFRTATTIMLATSWSLMVSAGLISLGHAAFWGVGSYACLLGAADLGLPIGAGLFLAMAVGAGVGAVQALVTGRLRGAFFAISTLAMAEGLRVAALMLPGLTHGAEGMFAPQALRPTPHALGVFGALLAVASVGLAWCLSGTRFHFAMTAMRSHEGAAQMIGIDPRRYRVAVVAISAAMASLAGGISAWYGGYLDPDVAFGLQTTITAQIAAILGGMFSVGGPVAGAIAVVALGDLTRGLFGGVQGASQGLFGLILVVTILFRPQGIIGLLRRARA